MLGAIGPILPSLATRIGDMPVLLPNIQLMPYAADTWSTEAIRLTRQGRGGLEIVCPFSCVALDRQSSTVLRLNNTRYDLDGMPDLTDSGGSEAHYIRELVRAQCRPWDTLAHSFVRRYFEVLEELLATHDGAIKQKLAPFEGLYDPAHFLFSAPRPFPRAHLFAPASSPAATLAPDDFVPVDFAFVLGDRLVAILPAQSGLTPKKVRERNERLHAAGISVATFSAQDLGAGAAAFFSRALAPCLPAFWDADPVPVGPFRPAGIEE